MGTLFAYSLGISLPLALLWLVFRLSLARATFHRFNRIVLLSIYAVSLSLIPVSGILSLLAPVADAVISVGDINAVVDGSTVVDGSGGMLLSVLLGIYVSGVVVVLLRLLYVLSRTVAIICKGEHIRRGRLHIVLHNERTLVPFSWCRWIVLSHDDYDERSDLIITHEESHLIRMHWVDLLVAEVVILINWFNPAAWLMRSSLQDVHEYEADERVLSDDKFDKEDYQLFLIKKTAGTRFASIASSLNHSSLKKRITMMYQKKTQSKVRMRAFALVPAAALALLFVNNQSFASALSNIASADVVSFDKDSEKTSVKGNSAAQIDALASDGGSQTVAVKVAEKMPQFPGGMGELMKFMAENVKYPDEAARNNVQGVVVVRFVVTASGKVISPQIVRGVDARLDAEALRVVSLLPDFIPGEIGGRKVDVKYSLPVSFKL